MNINTNLLQTFLMLVKYDLNFTRAAKYLGVTQPAVTKNIKKLEALVGGSLFLRKGRVCYQLSDKGREILPVARKIIEQMDSLTHETSSRAKHTAQKSTFHH